MCFPELLPQAYQTFLYKACSNHLIQRLQSMLPAGKKEKRMMRPNYEQNLCPVFWQVPVGILRADDP